jgi:predicted helicase
VKFLRFSQWKIHKAGHGIVGMITNHSYLDNPTFRGMRQSLMNTFNEIYIIDLHGNSLKKETTPEGGKDENVFDIRQGVSIFIGIKEKNKNGCKVFADDLFGLRKEKYDWLERTKFSKRNYEIAKPHKPFYFLKKDNTKGIKEFLDWIPVQEIFPINSVGIVTARDKFVIDFDRNILEQRIRQFRNKNFDQTILARTYELKDTGAWSLSKARQEVAQDKNWEDYFTQILYRPFDIQEIYFHPAIIERDRRDVMQHLLQKNISLCFVRQYSGDEIYSHALVSEHIVDNRSFFSSKGIIQQAPLYLYKPTEPKRKSGLTMMLFEPEESYGKEGRKPNISKEVIEKLEKAYKSRFSPSPVERGGGEVFTPENLLHYVYAILYSNTYRQKYAEFLKIDFPRIPFTTEYRLFVQLAELGEQLTELHLLKSKSLNKPVAKYKGKGDDRVEKPTYDEEKQVVFINEKNYFEGVSTEVWNYHIGGYQVMEKYLKYRKGRLMEDPAHYCKMATALQQTILVQQKIDLLFNEVEKNIIS